MKVTLALAFVLAAVTAVCGSTEPEGVLSSSIQDELSSPVQNDLSIPVQYDLNSPVQNDLSIPVQYDLSIPVQNDLSNPVQDNINSLVQNDLKSPIEYVLNVGTAIARNSLLHRAQFIRGAISNAVLTHDHTWRGASSRVITSVRAYQVGANQGARAWVTAGGVGRSFVTVRIQSQRGRGFNVMVEVYGR